MDRKDKREVGREEEQVVIMGILNIIEGGRKRRKGLRIQER